MDEWTTLRTCSQAHGPCCHFNGSRAGYLTRSGEPWYKRITVPTSLMMRICAR